MARVQLVQGGTTPLTGGGADQGQQETGDNSQQQHHVRGALALLYRQLYGDKPVKFTFIE